MCEEIRVWVKYYANPSATKIRMSGADDVDDLKTRYVELKDPPEGTESLFAYFSTKRLPPDLSLTALDTSANNPIILSPHVWYSADDWEEGQ